MSAAHQSHCTTPKNRHRLNVTEDPIAETMGEPPRPSPTADFMSSREYERLLAGENVSWNQIMREHPMLGTITVAQLVNLGVVHVIPDHDPGTGTTDFRLCKLDPGVRVAAPLQNDEGHRSH